jgi:hypothetical protein
VVKLVVVVVVREERGMEGGEKKRTGRFLLGLFGSEVRGSSLWRERSIDTVVIGGSLEFVELKICAKNGSYSSFRSRGHAFLRHQLLTIRS